MNIGETLCVEAFFDPQTWTISYLVIDRSTLKAALIDSVLDYDPKSGRTHTESADKLTRCAFFPIWGRSPARCRSTRP